MTVKKTNLKKMRKSRAKNTRILNQDEIDNLLGFDVDSNKEELNLAREVLWQYHVFLETKDMLSRTNATWHATDVEIRYNEIGNQIILNNEYFAKKLAQVFN